MDGIREDELLSRKLKICENCEWYIPKSDMAICLIKATHTGLFGTCDRFKQRTGTHISM